METVSNMNRFFLDIFQLRSVACPGDIQNNNDKNINDSTKQEVL